MRNHLLELMFSKPDSIRSSPAELLTMLDDWIPSAEALRSLSSDGARGYDPDLIFGLEGHTRGLVALEVERKDRPS